MLAYLVGMTIAYLLNRLFVFERSGRAVADEYVRFGIVNLVALAQVWIVSVGLARCRVSGARFCLACRHGRACDRRRGAGVHQLFRAQALFVCGERRRRS